MVGSCINGRTTVDHFEVFNSLFSADVQRVGQGFIICVKYFNAVTLL